MKSEQTAGVDPRLGRAMVRRNAAFWVQAMAEQRASGFGVERFCHERGLARSTFQKWAVRLKRRALSAPYSAKARAQGNGAKRNEAMKFVPLPIASAASAPWLSATATVDMVLEGGVSLTLSGQAATRVIDTLVARIAGTTHA